LPVDKKDILARGAYNYPECPCRIGTAVDHISETGISDGNMIGRSKPENASF